ncbi:MAG: hypothetical protein QM790_17470 [Nibricoccus sp.]
MQSTQPGAHPEFSDKAQETFLGAEKFPLEIELEETLRKAGQNYEMKLTSTRGHFTGEFV